VKKNDRKVAQAVDGDRSSKPKPRACIRNKKGEKKALGVEGILAAAAI